MRKKSKYFKAITSFAQFSHDDNRIITMKSVGNILYKISEIKSLFSMEKAKSFHFIVNLLNFPYLGGITLCKSRINLKATV